MQLSTVTIKQIPDGVSAVTVMLAPAYNSIKIDGELGNTDNQEYQLNSDGNGTWSLSEPKYLLVESASSSISVSITKDGSTKSYTYNCPSDNLLQANYKFNITGTYTEQQTIQLNGTVTGATWEGSRDINFNFNESGTEDNNGNDDNGGNGGGSNTVSDNVPAAKSIYKDLCYVLSVEDNGSQYDVLLLYVDQTAGLYTANMAQDALKSAINTALANINVEGISGWRLPTYEESLIMYDQMGDINAKTSDIGHQLSLFDSYFINKNDVIQKTSNNVKNTFELDNNTNIYLRAVTTVKFNK